MAWQEITVQNCAGGTEVQYIDMTSQFRMIMYVSIMYLCHDLTETFLYLWVKYDCLVVL